VSESEACAVASVPAADVEGAVLDQVQKLLTAPELIVRTWAVVKPYENKITEREVTVLLAEFATVWNELFPPEQARIVQLLVERVVVRLDGLEIRLRVEGIRSVVEDLRRQEPERTAA
jgi:site-specific DNA recombinase